MRSIKHEAILFHTQFGSWSGQLNAKWADFVTIFLTLEWMIEIFNGTCMHGMNLEISIQEYDFLYAWITNVHLPLNICYVYPHERAINHTKWYFADERCAFTLIPKSLHEVNLFESIFSQFFRFSQRFRSNFAVSNEPIVTIFNLSYTPHLAISRLTRCFQCSIYRKVIHLYDPKTKQKLGNVNRFTILVSFFIYYKTRVFVPKVRLPLFLFPFQP